MDASDTPPKKERLEALLLRRSRGNCEYVLNSSFHTLNVGVVNIGKDAISLEILEGVLVGNGVFFIDH